MSFVELQSILKSILKESILNDRVIQMTEYIKV